MFRSITRNLSTIQIRNPRNPITPSLVSTPFNSSSIVSYLIDSIGLSPEKALAAGKRFNRTCNLDSKSNKIKARRDPNAVLSLLASNGFTKGQISNIISKQPGMLFWRPDRTLKPKIDYLLGAGLSRSDVARHTSEDMTILQASLNKKIIPMFNFLKTILYSDKDVIAVVKHTPRLLRWRAEERILPNIETLRGFGMPEHRIYTLFKSRTRILLCKPHLFRRSIERVRDLGFEVSDYAFIIALLCVSWLGAATWARKVAAFKSFGLSEDQILSAFKKTPAVMVLSEVKIKRTMSFFVSKLNWSPEYLVTKPYLLAYSLERRLLPRTLICEVLLSKGLMRSKALQLKAFLMNDKRFFEEYVMGLQKEHPQVLEIYQATLKQQH